MEAPQPGLDPPLEHFSLGFLIGRAPASEQEFAVTLIIHPGDPRTFEDEAEIDGRKRRIAGARGGEVQNPRTGQRIGAEEARRIGLVNKICEQKDLLDECGKMAAMICEAGPVAIEQAKYAINHGLETDLHTGLAIESNAYWVCIPTEDRLEGLAAFKEKRKPVYKGK